MEQKLAVAGIFMLIRTDNDRVKFLLSLKKEQENIDVAIS